MKLLLSLAIAVVSLAAPRVVGACDMADQYKLFPLGVHDGSVVALELDQIRTSDSPGAIYWIVRASLVQFDADGKRKHLARYQLDNVDGAAYDKSMRGVLTKALADARELEGFVEARQLRTQVCEYLDTCFEWSVDNDGDHPQLSRKVAKGSAAVATPVPGPLVEHANVEPDMLLLHLASVRHYEAGSLRFAVVDLGGGSFLDPCAHAAGPCIDDRKPSAHPAERDAEDTMYLEGPPHHGVNYDTVVRL